MREKFVPIIISTKGFMVLKSDNNHYETIMPEDTLVVPNVPFYHMIWTEKITILPANIGSMSPNIAQVKEFLKNEYGTLRKIVPVLLSASDLFAVDKQLLREYFLVMGIKKIPITNQSELFTTLGTLNYVAISASERIITIEKYIEGKVEAVKYLERNTYNLITIQSCVKEMTNDISTPIVYICDPSETLGELKNIGKVFNAQSLFELANKKGFPI